MARRDKGVTESAGARLSPAPRNPVAHKAQGRHRGHVINQKKGRGSYRRQKNVGYN